MIGSATVKSNSSAVCATGMGMKPRVGIISLLLVLVMLATSTPAMAATVTYWNGWATAGVYVTSAINDIYGGYAETFEVNSVTVRTTTSFYPYYPYVTATSAEWVSITHGTYDPARSRCKIEPHDGDVKCQYKT
jgi:hypothetical protein